MWVVPGYLLSFTAGLAFFTTGLALLVGSDPTSSFRLARRLPLLALFNLILAIVEWLPLLAPSGTSQSHPSMIALAAVETALTATAFSSLLTFSASLIAAETEPGEILRQVHLALGGLCLMIYLSSMPIGTSEPGPWLKWLAVSEAWARYLLVFPAGVLTALALHQQAPFARSLGSRALELDLNWAAIFFVLHAIFGGLVVPPVDFPPGRWLNTDLFEAWTGVSVTLLRVACVMAITYFMVRSLGIFRLENRRRLAEAEQQRLLAEERERVGRDLHDGVIQSIYGCSLLLENTAYAVAEQDAATAHSLEDVVRRLNRTTEEIRSYILQLSAPEQDQDSLADRLQGLVNEFAGLGSARIRLEVAGNQPPVSSERVAQLAIIARELLANAVKHSHAREITIALAGSTTGLKLSVQDDGIGLPPATPGAEHHGLRNLRHRAELLSGNLTVQSAPQKGTAITLEIPIGGSD
ncbi:MAG: sensor histidine kinase [Mycobacterium leprae]